MGYHFSLFINSLSIPSIHQSDIHHTPYSQHAYRYPKDRLPRGDVLSEGQGRRRHRLPDLEEWVLKLLAAVLRWVQTWLSHTHPVPKAARRTPKNSPKNTASKSKPTSATSATGSPYPVSSQT